MTEEYEEEEYEEYEEAREWLETMPDGRQVPLSEITDKHLGRCATKATRRLRRELYRILHLRDEIHARGLTDPQHYMDDIFVIARTSAALALNSYNGDA